MTPERWSTYKPCDQCDAAKGEACRDMRWAGKYWCPPKRWGYRCTHRPHAGRTRWTRVTPGVNR